jgi:hypothetical protein
MATKPQLRADVSPESIQEHLRRILESPAFRGSKRSQAFLKYVVQTAIEGRADALKERTIATEVFGRPQDVDLAEDTIVRVGAREVRRRLAQYYVSPEAARDTIHVELPPGSYTPEFRPVAPGAPPGATAVPVTERLRRWRSGIAGAGVLVLALAVWRWAGPERPAGPVQAFWAPFLAADQPPLFALAHPIVYHPSLRAVLKNEARNPAARGLVQQPIQLPPEELDGTDLVPVIDQYVGYGDLLAAVDLATYFASHGKPPRLRLASQLEFADMRESPTVLIGAFTNRWTLKIAGELRFRFTRTSDRRPSIEDSLQPGKIWALPVARQDGLTDEDYILLARLLQSSSGRPIAIIGGLKHFGTEAGARSLLDPGLLGEILGALPAGWQEKNFAAVLHAKVYGNSPTRPQVVGWHCW